MDNMVLDETMDNIHKNMQTSSKTVVATTVADAADHIEFFVKYHLSVGFEHVFVFIDDGCIKTFEKLSSFANVTALLPGKQLEEMRSLVPIYRDKVKRAILPTEVMARQEMNIFVAEILARNMGYQWLLHIDIDELFYPNETPLIDLVKNLKGSQIGGFNLLNYEAIPYKEDEQLHSDNIYTATHYFKKNFFKKWHWFYSDEQKEFLEKNEHWLPKLYFNYYQNGKSIVDLSSNLCVDDVHSIRSNGMKYQYGSHGDPLILHFPSVTFREYRKKYTRLGDFGSLWRGKKRAGKYIDTFHLESRDKLINDEREEFIRHYREKMMMSVERIEKLIHIEMAKEITDVCNLEAQINEYQYKIKSSESLANKAVSKIENNSVSENTLYIDSELALDLEGVESVEKYGITFKTLAEARIWMRRHPDKNSMAETKIYEYDKGKYCLLLNNKPVFNIQSSSCLKYLLGKCNSNVYTLCPELKYFHIQDYLGLSKMQYAASIFSALKSLLEDSEKSKGLVFQLHGEHESLLIDTIQSSNIQVINNLDHSLHSALAETLEKNNSYDFAVNIQGRYPRGGKVNWLVDTNKCAGNKDNSCYRATLLFMGGSVICFPKDRLPGCEEFLAIRERDSEFVSVYASPFLIEHEQIICLRKKTEKAEYLCFVNISDQDSMISKTQLEKHGVNREWQNLLTRDTHVLSQNLTLTPKSYLWLETDH